MCASCVSGCVHTLQSVWGACHSRDCSIIDFKVYLCLRWFTLHFPLFFSFFFTLFLSNPTHTNTPLPSILFSLPTTITTMPTYAIINGWVLQPLFTHLWLSSSCCPLYCKLQPPPSHLLFPQAMAAILDVIAVPYSIRAAVTVITGLFCCLETFSTDKYSALCHILCSRWMLNYLCTILTLWSNSSVGQFKFQ